jgi:hypothetical protein
MEKTLRASSDEAGRISSDAAVFDRLAPELTAGGVFTDPSRSFAERRYTNRG